MDQGTEAIADVSHPLVNDGRQRRIFHVLTHLAPVLKFRVNPLGGVDQRSSRSQIFIKSGTESAALRIL